MTASTAQIAFYLRGAFEARGSVSIARSGSGSVTGRISIDTTTLSPDLEALFGAPTVMRGYAKPTYRYLTGSRAEVAVIVTLITFAHPAPERLRELIILSACVEAATEAERIAAMDGLRALRAKRGTNAD